MVAAMPSNRASLTKFLGIQHNTHLNEQIISAIGGFFSIVIIFSVSYWITSFQGASAILPSMGAATVLLFAVPKGALSQPWALFAGNMLSAFVGVCCYQWLDNHFLAAGSAVGLSILLMFLFRCIHPPGGATALAAVIGGDAIHQLGFYYVIVPTLINCLIIFSVALVFNNLFGWRRYPALKTITEHRPGTHTILDESAIQLALDNLPAETKAALTAKDIKKIVESSQPHNSNQHQVVLEIDAFYTNDDPGFNWAIRQITGIYPHPNPEHDMISYQIIEGKNKRRHDSCQRIEFTRWAKRRVYFQ